MKALRFHEPGTVKLEETAVPEIGANELLVRLHAMSICGTDLRVYKKGHFKIPAGTKRVLGHELAGEVVKRGSLVEGFAEGTRVCIPPNIGCGQCEFCKQGYNNMCPAYEALGISIDGGFQEYMRVPHSAIVGGNVFEIPAQLSYEQAALAEPLSCCYNAFRSVQIGPKDVVVVIGAGPLGAMHVILSRIAGAKEILLANRSQDRLEFSARFGATGTVNTSAEDLSKAVMDRSEGRGADVVITAAPAPEIQAEAVQLLATHGRVNFFAGLGGASGVSIDTNRVHYKGLHLTGTTGSTNADYYDSLRLIADGRVPVEELITERFPLADGEAAFEHALSSRGMKTMMQAE